MKAVVILTLFTLASATPVRKSASTSNLPQNQSTREPNGWSDCMKECKLKHFNKYYPSVETLYSTCVGVCQKEFSWSNTDFLRPDHKTTFHNTYPKPPPAKKVTINQSCSGFGLQVVCNYL
ncbi:hypothetical protein PspLS_09243 [Pyricularia sp. CBS 133598]|nr:hypothetical protein PspLS_09243 [Pyricularia sp. CBS 133598]